ncbi:hypothetical protein SeMB42_g04705 [Synchytrium endobioticum]|uniref:Uncharacterized protein n=1 Tax=Synchytrium endobioticum TaxID=286115 RepID=A0A507CWQ0_9FUNG|nr:hypothetical protein SeMB42_g04705 [Synchytrium endobioticum]
MIASGPDTARIDFRDARAQRELTYALLAADFGIRLEIPLDSLIPPVPGRLDYVLWLSDLLPAQSALVDLGTGASCIYPLLACRLFPRWRFRALESDRRPYEYACANVARNALGARISVVHNESGVLLPLFAEQLAEHDSRIDAVMCNPPFYSSAQEIAQLANAKQLPPFAACTGSQAEMITPGGELGFITRMFQESASTPLMKNNVVWYTSLVGKREDVTAIEALCQDGNVARFKADVIKQAKTSRWIVAWSWLNA